MERKVYNKLLDWKSASNRKPLILQGASRTGKTWLLQEFGKAEYQNIVYISCKENLQNDQLFSDFDTDRLLRVFSALTEQSITPSETLIILDDLQAYPQAIDALKAFYQNAKQYHIVGASNQFNLTADKENLCFQNLYALSFMEYLKALGRDSLVQEIEKHNWTELNSLNKKLTELLRQYYLTGGMPEVVALYKESEDLRAIRNKQKEILENYHKTFEDAFTPKKLEKILMVWNAIAEQLNKDNKKFQYGALKKGSRATEFENALNYLTNAGLVHKVNRVTSLDAPLAASKEEDNFKLYLNDVGLFGAMSNVLAGELLIGTAGFSKNNKSLTEQFIFQQYLCAKEKEPFYYTNENSTMTLDFVFEDGITTGDRPQTAYAPIAVEVQAEENLKAKSIATVLQNGQVSSGIRFCLSDYRKADSLKVVPLAFAGEWINTKSSD